MPNFGHLVFPNEKLQVNLLRVVFEVPNIKNVKLCHTRKYTKWR